MLVCLVLVSAVTAVLVALTRRDLRLSFVAQATETRQQVASGIRLEVDRLRADSSEQGRALRQEVSDSVRGFQSTILQSFASLGEHQTEQMRGFGEDIKGGFARSEQRTGEIAQRVADELAKISASGIETSDRLRTGVEAKLDQFAERSTAAARELREEVTCGLKTLHESVTLTLDSRLKELKSATTTESQTTRNELNT